MQWACHTVTFCALSHALHLHACVGRCNLVNIEAEIFFPNLQVCTAQSLKHPCQCPPKLTQHSVAPKHSISNVTCRPSVGRESALSCHDIRYYRNIVYYDQELLQQKSCFTCAVCSNNSKPTTFEGWCRTCWCCCLTGCLMRHDSWRAAEGSLA